MLIKRVYRVDPLVCPKCGGKMKNIAFIEARQEDVIRKILEHFGVWREPPDPLPRAPPPAASKAVRTVLETDSVPNVEMDGDYLEHLHRASQAEQLELPWKPKTGDWRVGFSLDRVPGRGYYARRSPKGGPRAAVDFRKGGCRKAKAVQEAGGCRVAKQ